MYEQTMIKKCHDTLQTFISFYRFHASPSAYNTPYVFEYTNYSFNIILSPAKYNTKSTSLFQLFYPFSATETSVVFSVLHTSV